MEDNIGKGLDCIKICYYNPHITHNTLTHTERLVISFSSVLKTPGCFGVLLCDGDVVVMVRHGNNTLYTY